MYIGVTKLTGISFISSDISIQEKPTQMISEQAPGTAENGHVHPSSCYVNVALNELWYTWTYLNVQKYLLTWAFAYS